MYGALDISTSGLIAQRSHLEVIATNLANRDSYTTESGQPVPFRARIAFMAPGDPSAKTALGRRMGVHVASIEADRSSFTPRYDPDHPLAHTSGPYQGYVLQSNVNPVLEQINAVQVARAYEANLAAAEVTKAMLSQALRLIA